jgi:hypothetical protein
LFEFSRSEAYQREANARVDAILLAIAEGRMEPPVPHLLKSKKHHKQEGQYADRLPFEARSAKGQRKLVKRFVVEEMARTAQGGQRNWTVDQPKPPPDPYARPEPTRKILSLKPRPVETQEQAEARIARVNRALLRDLGVKTDAP